MHPAYSVIVFTTLTGAGYGLLGLLGLAGAAHGPASGLWFGATALLTAFGLITAGLLASMLHLGRPERAWRALSQWRSSWLAREGVASVLAYVPALAFSAVWLRLIDAPRLIAPFGLITALASALTVFCTAQIYASLKPIRQWRQPLTAPVYFAFAFATGAGLLLVIAALFARFQPVQAGLAAAGLLTALVLKGLYWRAIDRLDKSLTPADATGLARAGGRVRQWEAPHTARNFVMAEMGYRIARAHALSLRRIVLAALAVAMLIVLAILVLPGLAGLLSLIAAALALAAAVIERWLFFAEAQHVVTLYYGANRA